MAKVRKRFVCQACGSVSSRWQGQCADCAEWNTLVEDTSAVVTPFSARHDLRSGGRAVELVGLDADVVLPPRTGTGIKERSEEHTSELKSLMPISSAVFCLKKKKATQQNDT